MLVHHQSQFINHSNNMSAKMIFSTTILVTFVVTSFGASITAPSISTSQKNFITNYLNMYRYTNNIEWDDTLAELAQTSAEACPIDTLNEQDETDEIMIYLPNSFDVETDTVLMFKSVEHNSDLVRLYTCNPTILRFGTADKVGCGYHTGCGEGNAFVCVFSPKGPAYCSL